MKNCRMNGKIRRRKIPLKRKRRNCPLNNCRNSSCCRKNGSCRRRMMNCGKNGTMMKNCPMNGRSMRSRMNGSCRFCRKTWLPKNCFSLNRNENCRPPMTSGKTCSCLPMYRHSLMQKSCCVTRLHPSALHRNLHLYGLRFLRLLMKSVWPWKYRGCNGKAKPNLPCSLRRKYVPRRCRKCGSHRRGW